MMNRVHIIAVQILFVCIAMTGWLSVADAFDPKHMAYDGCNTCHTLHGSPGFSLLAGIDTESTCLGCHGPLGIAEAPEVSIHDPAGVGMGGIGYITCRECHTKHASVGTNITMLGYDYDPETLSSFVDPTIRIELPTSPPIDDPQTFLTVVYETRSDFSRVSNDGVCQICHTAGPASGAVTDLNNHQWGDCVICHGHNDGFNKRQCVDCHDDNSIVSATAPKILDKSGGNTVAVGSHLQAFIGEGIVGLSDLDWTVQCIKCHTGHTGDVTILNNPTVGIDYQLTGGVGLGGSATLVAATSEAEICWDCHTTEGITEWGTTSADTNGSFPNFDYGSLDQDSWVGATWTSANFQYKTDTIQSTHAANPVDGVEGVDLVDDIRCTYCHDVHDLNAANGDSVSGSPYLRGSWMGNPYREDGAPRWDGAAQDRHTYAENQTFGAVPRGNRGPDTSHYRTTEPPNDAYNYEMGGYWIDQNSGFPTRNTAYDTATETASLCELCHGDGDGAWAATEIDSIDEFVGNNWLGTNGHANSVVSGSGTASGNAFNIFTNSLRGNALSSVSADSLGQRRAYTNTGGMGYFGWTSGSRLWGVRNNDEKSWYIGAEDAGTGVFPVAENPQQWGDARRAFHSTYGSGFEWGNYWVATDPDVTQDNTTTDDRYHQFTCSKCHNPHASRLPRLMISNCLDVRINTWDDQTSFDGQQGYAGDSDWTASGIDYTSMVQSPGSQELAYAISAQNCHRAVDASSGWNTITPPNGPGGAWP